MKAQRHPRTPRILEITPMVEADLELLRQPSARPSLTRIKDSHHNVARLLASGLPQWRVAQECGFSIGRLSILVNDPAIQELIAKYRDRVTEQWVENIDEFQRVAIGNMVKAERQLSEALEEADEDGGEKLPPKTLIAIVADRADRFGYGKKTLNTNINVDFAANLEAAIARTKKVSVA